MRRLGTRWGRCGCLVSFVALLVAVFPGDAFAVWGAAAPSGDTIPVWGLFLLAALVLGVAMRFLRVGTLTGRTASVLTMLLCISLTARADKIVLPDPLPPAGMVLVPAGTFTMGSRLVDGATPEHSVTVSSFYLGAHEITYQLWHDVKTWADTHGYTFANEGREGHDGTIGAAPTGASNEPVTYVSWRDAIVWCNARSEQAGLTPVYTYSSATITNATDTTACDNAVFTPSASGYRLPTEAQWEYAARYQDGVTFTPGDYLSGATANETDTAASQRVAWYSANFKGASKTHEVGGKIANQLLVYDMSGNVFEWCWDWYDSDYYSSSPGSDPTGPASGSSRVHRGGSWSVYAFRARVAFRFYSAPSYYYYSLGFRVCLPLAAP